MQTNPNQTSWFRTRSNDLLRPENLWSTKTQNKAIQYIEEGKWFRGRVTGFSKIVPIIYDVALQIFFGLGNVLCGSLKTGGAHLLFAVQISFDALSIFNNIFNPLYYKPAATKQPQQDPRIAQLTAEKAALEERLMYLGKAQEIKDDKIVKLEEKIDRKSDKLFNLRFMSEDQEGSSNSNSTVAALTAEKAALEEHVINLGRAQEVKDAEIVELEEKIARKSDKLFNLRNTFADDQKEFSNSNSTVAALAAEKAALDERIAKLNESGGTLLTTIRNLSTQNAQPTTTHHDRAANAQESLRLADAYGELTTELISLRSERQDLCDKHRKALDDNRALDRALNMKAAKISELTIQLEKLQAEHR
jgi:chromosome segregation ATPase